ncbi:MAG TPA: hypothetical protein VMT54_21730 [Candidatus Cybelea sp.]|nr:hypothetical protein [Candidatus Cybelea sp.]
MTGSKKPKTETQSKGKKPGAETELSDAALAQASGGALNAYMPTDQIGAGGGGGAGKTHTALGDGSVKTNSALIGLL